LREIDSNWIGGGRLRHAEDSHLAYRALMMVVSGAIDLFLESDTARPAFHRIISPLRKWGDNPDGIYLFALIDGERSYRIRGRRGLEVYQSITVHGGDREGNWPSGVLSDLNHTAIHYEHDGSYEIVLSAEQQGRNWMRTGPDAGSVIMRFYHTSSPPAALVAACQPEVTIEAIDPPTEPPAALDDATVAQRLRRARNWIRSKFGFQLLPDPTHVRLPAWFSSNVNQLGEPANWRSATEGGGWGAVDAIYCAGNYELGTDQVLLLEGQLPLACYAGVALWNSFGQTEDYRYRRISLNHTQMQLDDQRRFRIVVAHGDPGVSDWLDTAGREHGTIYWRYLLPQEQPQRPSLRIIGREQWLSIRETS
jgi:hypothetical protein